jgi:hypothetical protein
MNDVPLTYQCIPDRSRIPGDLIMTFHQFRLLDRWLHVIVITGEDGYEEDWDGNLWENAKEVSSAMHRASNGRGVGLISEE